jgi:Tol biopolymer transport system component
MYVLWSRIGGSMKQGLVERRADASEPERVVLTRAQFGHSVADAHWLPDHRTLLVSTYVDGPNGRDVYAITPGQDSVARPVAVLTGNQTAAISSPDGTVVAYTSDETGVREIYVQPFPSGTGRVKVSDGGASSARWSRDGRTLYYWNQRSELVAASIQFKPTLQVIATRRVATGHLLATGGGQSGGLFDIAPDGRPIVAEDVPGTFQLILVRNWMAGLSKSAQ